METELTKSIKTALWKETKKQGVFGCFEVTIGWFGHERVDYMTYDTKGTWRCYEVKITKSDFHSKAHNTFVGDFNYYAMPEELYDSVKDDIPLGIGVYLYYETQGFKHCETYKNAKRRPLAADEQTLKNSMIRSLCRDVDNAIQCTDMDVINRYKREADRLEKQYRDLEQRFTDTRNELYYLKHPERKHEFTEESK